jgi:hypothetical protein
MQGPLLREFRCRRFTIRARWEALLRAEPVNTPLGLPDALVHLIDTTLEEIFGAVEVSRKRHPVHEQGGETHGMPLCLCGRNPLLTYFVAAEQAMREGLILAQAASAPLDPVERDASLLELNAALQQISRREIEAFCGVCQFRHLALPAPVQPLAICGR